jgi:CubicO group peptidase (beta-lactamase class C family)
MPAAAARCENGRVEDWIAATVPGLLEATGTPGLSVALAHRGRVWSAAFGDLQEGSVMPAGSMAKPYTAAAVMQLVERGAIGLDDPVAPYLPDLALANPHGPRPVTVRDLLAFRSGLATDTTSARLGGVPPPLAAHLRQALAQPVLREYRSGIPRWAGPVGERYRYANLGIAVLGRLVEVLAGRPFAEHVGAAVLAPLGMRSSAFAPGGDPGMLPADMRAALAPGHARFGRALVPTPPIRSADHPANGLYTTPREHLRLLLALLAGGAGVLAPETVQLMRTPQSALGDPRIAADGSWHAGLGLIVTPEHFGHPGSHMWGWWHVSRAYPKLGLAVVAMTDCWDMLRWQDPANEEPASVLVDAIAARAAATGPLPPVRPWTWRRSYVAGLIMAERTYGLLAADGELLLEPGGDWDASAFARGIADVRDAPRGRDPVGELARAGRLGVGAYELDLIASCLGARRGLPLPLWFWD